MACVADAEHGKERAEERYAPDDQHNQLKLDHHDLHRLLYGPGATPGSGHAAGGRLPASGGFRLTW
ncbi:hypothetical protein GCM10009785_23800 [Brooklawnia cerclae]